MPFPPKDATKERLPSVLSRPSSRGNLLQPLARPTELASAFAAELEARKRSAARHRALLKTATASSRALLHATRRSHVATVRAEWDSLTGKDLMERLKMVQPASDAEMDDLSVKLNVAMCRAWPEARSQSSYFRLFRLMDRDSSGLISFYELVKMLRETLHLPHNKLGEDHVLKVWRAIDRDSSGTIASGEFLRLARRGWDAFLQEQSRLSKTASLTRRPNWSEPGSIPIDKPAWREQTITAAEKSRFYLETARMEVRDANTRFSEAARQYADQERAWTTKLETSLAKLQRRTDKFKASVGYAVGTGTQRLNRSATAPA